MRRSPTRVLALALIFPGVGARAGSSVSGVVGAWEARSAAGIVGLRIEPVNEQGGCLRFAGGGFDLDDHPSLDRGLFWKVHKASPGRYAIVGVRWGAGGYPTSYYGVSRDAGEPWTFTVEAGAVTDIGVWRVTKPYSARYLVEGFDIAASRAEAQARAGNAALVRIAAPSRAAVADKSAACPP